TPPHSREVHNPRLAAAQRAGFCLWYHWSHNPIAARGKKLRRIFVTKDFVKPRNANRRESALISDRRLHLCRRDFVNRRANLRFAWLRVAWRMNSTAYDEPNDFLLPCWLSKSTGLALPPARRAKALSPRRCLRRSQAWRGGG